MVQVESGAGKLEPAVGSAPPGGIEWAASDGGDYRLEVLPEETKPASAADWVDNGVLQGPSRPSAGSVKLLCLWVMVVWTLRLVKRHGGFVDGVNLCSLAFDLGFGGRKKSCHLEGSPKSDIMAV
ncbi:hypothetical protein AMTR_s00128p00023560 [Amborella trichopoda]|uniref:Uncharacterized protein n=1 Tax=Amborella trichopoda TaxID=13333 RepID=W1NLS9_AMBTC|nr:hypothetical protein AMTR_s00128p00023560 [Amborella trichopoda]